MPTALMMSSPARGSWPALFWFAAIPSCREWSPPCLGGCQPEIQTNISMEAFEKIEGCS
jgi:hypothetical protein